MVVLRRAGRVLTLLVLVATTLLLVVVVLVPWLAGATAYTVLSGSMRPALPPGDLVVVRPTPLQDVGVGTVVTYQLRSGDPAVVTHRVVEVSIDDEGHRRYRLQGDANESPDPGWVRPEQLRGTVWYAVPHLGRVAQAWTPATRARLRVAAALGLLAYAAVMFTRSARGAVRRRQAPLVLEARHG